jgi:hypothetical protein
MDIFWILWMLLYVDLWVVAGVIIGYTLMDFTKPKKHNVRAFFFAQAFWPLVFVFINVMLIVRVIWEVCTFCAPSTD